MAVREPGSLKTNTLGPVRDFDINCKPSNPVLGQNII